MTGRAGREEVLTQCRLLDGIELSYPFDEGTAVFKVGGRMLALISLGDTPGRVTVKCDPDAAVALRGSYGAIQPGYHMNKRHWITITLGADVPDALVTDLVADSYSLVVSALPAHLRPADQKQAPAR